MKDKILFWIGNAYISFGIARSLQQKYDCELFGISDADGNAKEYLQNQKIVDFKKIWYYPHYLQDSKKGPNIEYLSKFENKYNINLWQFIYLDRRLVKETQRYYKFSRKEHLLILEQACRFLESVLNDAQPNFFIIGGATIAHNDHLLYCMCKTLGIKSIMLRPSRIGYRIALSENIERLDEIDIKNQKYSRTKTLEDVQNYFKKYNFLKQIDDFIPDYKVSKFEKIKAILEFFILPKHSVNMSYINYGKTRMSILKQGLAIQQRLRKNKIKSFMDKNFLRTIKNEPFVYFPFHKEPERYLSVGAPYFTDQNSVAKSIARSLPINFKLYVKDHPAQLTLTTMWKRSIAYYQEILDLPNIELIHPSVSTKEIIKKCSLVFTINGTTTLEAAIYNKPSIILTDADFVSLPSVLKIDKIQDFSNALKKALDQKVDPEALSEYMDMIHKNSIEVDTFKLRKDFDTRFPYAGFLKWPEQKVEKVNDFLDSNKDFFDLLADGHIKKIKRHKEIQLN